jgi:hypothetical protein
MYMNEGRKGYRPEDIVVLTDDSPHRRSQPTRQNIIDAMLWLVRDAHTHDALFFHCEYMVGGASAAFSPLTLTY